MFHAALLANSLLVLILVALLLREVRLRIALQRLLAKLLYSRRNQDGDTERFDVAAGGGGPSARRV